MLGFSLLCSSCRLDISGNIKVSDFGLAEDVYTRGYFKQSKDGSDNVRLPYKWIPPESFQDGVFSEKSDVVGDYNYPTAQLALTLYMSSFHSPSGLLV